MTKNKYKLSDLLKGKLFRKLTIYFMVLYIICTIVLTAFYCYLEVKRDKESYVINTKVTLSEKLRIMESSLQNINILSDSIIKSDVIWNGMIISSSQSDDFLDLESSIRLMLSNLYHSSSHINNTSLYMDTTNRLYEVNSEVIREDMLFSNIMSKNELILEKWYFRSLETPGEYVYYFDDNKELNVCIALLNPFNEEEGFYLSYRIDNMFFNEFFENNDNDSECIIIFDDNWNLAYYNNEDYIKYKDLIKEDIIQIKQQNRDSIDVKYNQSEIIVYSDSSDEKWTIAKIVPTKNIAEISFDEIGIFILISTLVVLVSTAAIVKISLSLTKPIMILADKMTNAESDDYTFDLTYTKNDEIGILYNKYDELMKQTKTLITEKYMISLQSERARMESIRSQINPHFMYNVLQLISDLAIESNNTKIEEITDAFGMMLRYNIASKSEMVRVAEEINAVEKYIYVLEQIHEGKLKVNLEVEDQCNKCIIMPGIIQPLVENSMKHGLSRKICNWQINVKIYSKESLLYIVVKDNGIGMDQKAIKVINDMDQTIANTNDIVGGKGLGLLKSRIKSKYNGEYGIHVESMLNIGTTVTLIFPCTADSSDDKES